MKLLLAILLVLPLWACAQQGPFERAGKNADRAIGNVRDGAKDVADDVRDGAKDVRDDVKRSRRR
jgi:predicted small lipoprotein YifL